MTAREFNEAQEQLEPKEDLAPYAGQWVALRKGRVVASDLDPVRLRQHAKLGDDDVILPVAHTEGGYLVTQTLGRGGVLPS